MKTFEVSWRSWSDLIYLEIIHGLLLGIIHLVRMGVYQGGKKC